MSIAEGIAGETKHCPIMSARTGATGAAVSLMVTFWLAATIFPLPSSKVQTTTVVPCAVIGKTVFAVPVMVPEQLSVAVGAVNEAEHSAATSGRIGRMGAILSKIITF
ncbi:hypothetical protein D3C87_985810 [compost metagenome]